MSRIAIDFAPRAPLRGHPLAWLGIVAGLTLCACAFFAAQTLRQDVDTQEAALRQAKLKLRERGERQPAVAKSVVTAQQAEAVNGAIAQLNLPWRDLFDSIESATPQNIALLELQPDAKRNLVKGMAEAKTSDDMIGYIEQLKRQEFFTAVVLTRHEINEQDPNKPLRFHFEARWAGVQP